MITSTDTSDVLIVGGGPAGSTCAWRLRQLGVEVQILDRAAFPRDKVCAGWITPPVAEQLQLDLVDYLTSRVLQPIRSFRVGVLEEPGRKLNRRTQSEQSSQQKSDDLIQIDYDQVVSYGIRRCEFDEFLLRRSGAVVHEGVGIDSIKRDGDHWLVNDRFRARLLIGAGGHFCPVARHLRSTCEASDERPVVMAQEAEFKLSSTTARDCRIEPGVPELFFYPDMQGYAWCFRKGDWLNVGLGREGEQHLSQWRDQFVNWLVETGRIAEAPDVPFKGHAYRLHVLTSSLVAGDGILLIGDATGLADCHSGEGIRPAIESALLAADTIAEAGGAADATELYARKLKQQFPGETTRLPSLIPTPVRTWLVRHLLRNRRFVRRIVLDDWFLNRSGESTLPLKSGTS